MFPKIGFSQWSRYRWSRERVGSIVMLFRKHFHLEEDLSLSTRGTIQMSCEPLPLWPRAKKRKERRKKLFPFPVVGEMKWLAVKWCKDYDDHDQSSFVVSCTRNSMQSIFSHILGYSQRSHLVLNRDSTHFHHWQKTTFSPR